MPPPENLNTNCLAWKTKMQIANAIFDVDRQG